MQSLTFEQWMKKIDRLLIIRIGLSTDDLPDMNYCDLYESGTSVSEMVEEILVENDFEEGEY